MSYKTLAFLGLTLAIATARAQNIVISDDDGWATAQIRAQYESLTDAGYNVRCSWGIWCSPMPRDVLGGPVVPRAQPVWEGLAFENA